MATCCCMFVLLTGRVTEHAGMHSGKDRKPKDCAITPYHALVVLDALDLLANRDRRSTQ